MRLFPSSLLVVLALAGCGGGGGRSRSGGSSTVGAEVAIAWPDRARAVTAPGAATVAQITLFGAASGGDDVTQVVERPSGAAAIVQTYLLSRPVHPGTYLLRVDFGADRAQLGDPLATAAANVRVAADGKLTRVDGSALGTIFYESNIQSVALATGQSLAVGATADLAVTALNKDGRTVALAAGSATFAVTSGGAFLRANPDGSFTGLAEGVATVVPTVDGLTGAPVAVNVGTPGIATLATRTVAVANDAFLYDPTRNLFWLATPSTAPNGNSVRSLSPSGALGSPINVGSEPSVLAISDDGSTLYAGLRGAGAVRRIDLGTNTAGLQFSVGSTGFGSPAYALDLAVQPGHPETVALTAQEFASSGNNGATIFDNGVARPNKLGIYRGTHLFWDGLSRIVSYNGSDTSAALYDVRVDANGATLAREQWNGLGAFSREFVLAGGRVYDSTGIVANAATFERAGTFNLGPFGFETTFGPAVDLAAKRAYFVQVSRTAVRLRVFRTDTFVEVATRNLDVTPPTTPFFNPPTARVSRWGTAGLAFSLGDRIVFIDDVSGL